MVGFEGWPNLLTRTLSIARARGEKSNGSSGVGYQMNQRVLGVRAVVVGILCCGSAVGRFCALRAVFSQPECAGDSWAGCVRFVSGPARVLFQVGWVRGFSQASRA